MRSRFDVVGIMGPAGCGKTTFAEQLIRCHGFRSYSFAKPLKDLCAQQFGWDRDRLDELAYKEEQDPNLPAGWTRRRVLQFVGTDAFRHIDHEHWVKAARRELETQRTLCERGAQGPTLYVIPDLRFKNEAALVTELGGALVRLERLGFDSGTEHTAHVSEQEWRQITPTHSYFAASGVGYVHDVADLFAEVRFAS